MQDEADSSWPISGVRTGAGHRQMARVYFADTDFSGVVYHARYLEFLERGRSDFLRHAGVRHGELLEGEEGGERLVWIVRRMVIEFRGSARIDDVLTIDTRIAGISGARIEMAQEIRRRTELLVEARVEAAIIDARGRPRRFPKSWLEAFASPGEASR